MHSMPRNLRCLVAGGAAVLLVGGCSHSAAPAHATGPSSAAETSAKQHYLDTVNGLCDELLPKVIQVTHGAISIYRRGSTFRTGRITKRVLSAFDRSLAAVPVPAAAASAADALGNYVKFADGLDAARLKAARQGEQAWRREVASEADVESSPAIAARTAAGFASSCDAR